MPSSWNLPGRERELVALAAALREGRGAYLTGPAGVGKSRLAEEVAGRAAGDGHDVVAVRATRGASDLPLAPFLGLVGSGAAGEGELSRLFGQIREHLQHRAGDRVVLLTVDDIDLLDDASLVFVHQMVAAGAARLLTTLRTGRIPPAELLDLVQRGDVDRVDVRPFPRGDADRVAAEIAGVTFDGPSLDRLWALCRGNALFLREVLTAAATGGAITPGPAGATLRELPVDAPNLVQVVEHRLAALTPALRHALLHLAFAEPCGPGELVGVADARMLATLEEAELLRAETDGQRLHLRLSHPIYGEVLRARTGPLQRRAVLAQLARGLEATGARRRADLVKLARLAVEGGVDVEPEVLVRATSLSYHAGDLALSERIGRRAFERTGSFAAGWDVFNCLVGSGDLIGAREHLTAWRPAATRRSATLAIAIADAQLAYWLAGDEPAALGRYEEALATVPEDEVDPAVPTITRAELRADRALVEAMSGRPADALELALPLLDHDVEQVVIRAAFAASHALRAQGRPGAALDVLDRARQAYRVIGQEAVSLSRRFLRRERAMALAALGQLEDAQREADRIGRDTTNESYQALALSARAALDAVAGRPLSAIAHIERATALAGGIDRFAVAARWQLATLALVRASSGDLDGAEEALAGFDADRHPARTLDVWAEIARARLLRARGFPEQARQVLRQEIVRDRERAAIHDEFFTSYELMRQERPAEVVARVEELAALTDGPLYSLLARHVRAVAGANVAMLGDVVEALAAAGFDPYASEAALAASEAAQRTGQTREATRWLNRARALRARCEATPVVADLAPILVSITRREREIAVLAAQGLASKQIGARLFISARTVDNHLAKVYVKLGVRTRAELAALLGDSVVAF